VCAQRVWGRGGCLHAAGEVVHQVTHAPTPVEQVTVRLHVCVCVGVYVAREARWEGGMEDSRGRHSCTILTVICCYNSMFWTAVNTLGHQTVANNGKQSAHTQEAYLCHPPVSKGTSG
jgi:hypothetical protein